MRIALAQLDPTSGDIDGNTQKVLDAITEATARGAELLVTPEMCIPGYSLGDRLMMRGTLARSWRALQDLLPDTDGIVVLVGLPVRHRDVLYNVVAVCADGRISPKSRLSALVASAMSRACPSSAIDIG